MEHGSDDLREAWVSVCAHAKTHDVEHVPLRHILDCIAGDATLAVARTKASGETWRHDVDLVGLTERIRELFGAGVEAAHRINAKTFVRLLNELGLEADPEDVEPVVCQPKKSEKVFYLTVIRVNGAEYPVDKRVVYEDPETLGKRKCEDTKRQLPGVLFAAVFDPSRDKDFFRQHTELYPLDADHVAEPAALRRLVSRHPSVFAAFLSATGNGLPILVRGPRVTDKDDYDDVYMRILRVLGTVASNIRHRQSVPSGQCKHRGVAVDTAPHDPRLPFSSSLVKAAQRSRAYDRV